MKDIENLNIMAISNTNMQWANQLTHLAKIGYNLLLLKTYNDRNLRSFVQIRQFEVDKWNT